MVADARTAPARIAVAAFALPALGFAARPALFERPPVELGGRRRARRLPGRHLHPEGDHDRRRASARSARRPSTSARRNPEIDGPKRPGHPRLRRLRRASPRAACTSAARSATSRRQALHLPVPRRRLRLHRQVDGGPPVRPLDRFYTRVARRPGRGRPALLGQLRARALPATAIPARPSTASASTCTRGRFSTPKLGLSHAQAPAPATAPAAPAAAASGPARPRRSSRSTRPRRPGSPRSTGSTSARRCRAALRWMMFRKVPKGTNWFYTLGSATMFAFLSQAVTGVFLAMYYDPSATRRLRVDAPHHQRGLPRRVRARHAQVGLVGDGDPHLPAHGAGRSSSAPTSTRAS